MLPRGLKTILLQNSVERDKENASKNDRKRMGSIPKYTDVSFIFAEVKKRKAGNIDVLWNPAFCLT